MHTDPTVVCVYSIYDIYECYIYLYIGEYVPRSLAESGNGERCVGGDCEKNAMGILSPFDIRALHIHFNTTMLFRAMVTLRFSFNVLCAPHHTATANTQLFENFR